MEKGHQALTIAAHGGVRVCRWVPIGYARVISAGGRHPATAGGASRRRGRGAAMDLRGGIYGRGVEGSGPRAVLLDAGDAERGKRRPEKRPGTLPVDPDVQCTEVPGR